MKYIKNIAMLMVALCATLLTVSCTDDTTESTGVADRLFRPTGIKLTNSGTTMTASWAGITDAVGYWCELYKRTSAGQNSTGATQYNYDLVASNELVTATEWKVSGLDRNETYAFRVKSIHADMAKNSYFSDFYTSRIPGMTEVLVATVLDPVAALVRFEWMEGYNIQWVKITAPDGGVRTINVDDSKGSFEMDGFVSGTFKAVAGNSTNTYNEVTFLIPVFYEVNAALITFDSVHFEWRVDPDITTLVLTNVANPSDVHRYDLPAESVNTAQYDVPAADLQAETTYRAQLLYSAASGKEPSNVVSFTTMMTKPEGVVMVETIDELLAEIAGGTAIIALQPGDYVSPANIEVNHAFTLMAATKKQPKVIVNQFTMNNKEYVDGTLRFEGIEFECTNLNNTTSCFIDHSGQTANFKRVEIENCYIHDYGSSFMRFNRQETSVEEVYVNNNQLLRMYGQNSFLQFTKVNMKEVTFTNNTATGLDTQKAGVRFLTYNADGNTRVVFTNNTILFHNSTGRLFFHINTSGDAGFITITDNIFFNEDPEAPRNVDNFASRTVVATISNNVVASPWGAGNDGGSVSEDTLAAWGDGYLQADPGFKNASKFDFTVTNEDVLKTGAGDPRWLK